MKMFNINDIKNEQGKVPIALLIIVVIVIAAAVTAALAFTGAINIKGITPEKKAAPAAQQVEVTAEDQLTGQVQQLARQNTDSQKTIAALEEKVELKDERIETLQADVAKLQDLIQLSDANAVKDVAAVYETMSPENSVTILSKFDPEKTVLILKAMDQKKAGAILEGMDPDIAAKITQIMAGFVNPIREMTEPPAPAETVPPEAAASAN